MCIRDRHEGQTRKRLCVGELARYAGIGRGLRMGGTQVRCV